jgi:hypothetical protein
MLDCGTLQLSDLQVGQIVKFLGSPSAKTSTWILLEESTVTSTVGNRNFKLWCLATVNADSSLCIPGMTTEYEFNHHNISSYQIISSI